MDGISDGRRTSSSRVPPRDFTSCRRRIAADCQAPNRLLPRLPLLTTMRQVHLLTFEQASRAYPVRLRGVVTFYDPYQQGNPALFIADATGTIFVKLPHGGILSLQMG